MPYKRPTLTELQGLNQSAIETNLASSEIGKLLRFSTLKILGDADAGLAHLHFGYLDYIALQSTPATATDEYLAAWGALKKVTQKKANAATCTSFAFEGVAGSQINAGSVLNRSDGYQYTVDTAVTINAQGTGTSTITAVLPDATTDPTGGGASGNADAGTILTFDVTPTGVSSSATAVTAISGGSDIESEDAYRTRVLLAYQSTPQGGNRADYVEWALACSGVTRAWVSPRLLGAGTVVIYIMKDGAGSTNDTGFPVGTDGLSTYETGYSGGFAAGDQLAVANAIYQERPVTSLVYVCSPIKTVVPFVISGLSSASSTVTAAIATAINTIFFESSPGGVLLSDLTTGGKINLSDINAAIAAISGTDGFVITSPSTNIVMGTGGIPVLGTITYT